MTAKEVKQIAEKLGRCQIGITLTLRFESDQSPDVTIDRLSALMKELGHKDALGFEYVEEK